MSIKWNDYLNEVPRDQRLLFLKVEGGEHNTQDKKQWITIGFLDTQSDQMDKWKFAGWCWSHDHFVNVETEVVPCINEPSVIAWANLNKEDMDNA